MTCTIVSSAGGNVENFRRLNCAMVLLLSGASCVWAAEARQPYDLPNQETVYVEPQNPVPPHKVAGIDAQFRKNDQGAYIVVSIEAGGAAQESGLKLGDRLVTVNGRKTDGVKTETLSDWIRGKAGSRVKLTVKGLAGQPRKISIKRRKSEALF